jgi:tRNA threonylcarbamoyladenosine biosynthesis protein TsaB
MKDSKTVRLFINTATKALQFGVWIDNTQSLRIEMGNPKTALERSNLGIKTLLDQLGLTLQDVDAFYCLLGPGSNTGIRLGLTIPRTIYAFNPNIKVYGIKTMDLFLADEEAERAALSDRNGNIYLAERKNGQIEVNRVDKKDIPTLDKKAPLIVEEKDKLALDELEGFSTIKIDVLTKMMEKRNSFEDFSDKEEDFLPEYVLKI